jgi:putative transposase
MRPSRFTNEQVLQALQQVACGTPAVQVCRALGITQTTFYRWRRAHERGPAGERPGMRALRAENLGLKQLVADLLLEVKQLGGRKHR